MQLGDCAAVCVCETCLMVSCILLLNRLKPLDVEVMKQLHHKVNIIPLIAKADTMTADECRDFKKTVSF